MIKLELEVMMYQLNQDKNFDVRDRILSNSMVCDNREAIRYLKTEWFCYNFDNFDQLNFKRERIENI